MTHDTRALLLFGYPVFVRVRVLLFSLPPSPCPSPLPLPLLHYFLIFCFCLSLYFIPPTTVLFTFLSSLSVCIPLSLFALTWRCECSSIRFPAISGIWYIYMTGDVSNSSSVRTAVGLQNVSLFLLLVRQASCCFFRPKPQVWKRQFSNFLVLCFMCSATGCCFF